MCLGRRHLIPPVTTHHDPRKVDRILSAGCYGRTVLGVFLIKVRGRTSKESAGVVAEMSARLLLYLELGVLLLSYSYCRSAGPYSYVYRPYQVPIIKIIAHYLGFWSLKVVKKGEEAAALPSTSEKLPSSLA